MTQKNFDLLTQKYGHAFVLINNVEFLLGILLFKKGGLYKINHTLRGKLTDDTTLGRKYSLSKDMISNKKLKKDMGKLIEIRKKMAHKWLTPFSGKNADDWVFIGNGNIAEKVDKNFFDETIKLSYNIVKKLIPISGVENIEA